jgi:hypothetical protein
VSEETTMALAEAMEKEARVTEAAYLEKSELLAKIAREMPGKVEELAKRVAQSKPEVTKALGKDGVANFRAELAEVTAPIAADIADAAARIEWPKPEEWGSVSPHQIHSSLFKYLYVRVDKIAGVFKRHGYDVHDDVPSRKQGLVLPQSLYNQNDPEFVGLAQTLDKLAKATYRTTKAKAEDDSAIVADLWGG